LSNTSFPRYLGDIKKVNPFFVLNTDGIWGPPLTGYYNNLVQGFLKFYLGTPRGMGVGRIFPGGQ